MLLNSHNCDEDSLRRVGYASHRGGRWEERGGLRSEGEGSALITVGGKWISRGGIS